MAEVNMESFIDYVENMTVLELSKLVKALEERLGVSAAAPVAVAAVAGGAAPAAAAEEKTEFDVILASFGDNKVADIEVRARRIASDRLKHTLRKQLPRIRIGKTALMVEHSLAVLALSKVFGMFLFKTTAKPRYPLDPGIRILSRQIFRNRMTINREFPVIIGRNSDPGPSKKRLHMIILTAAIQRHR